MWNFIICSSHISNIFSVLIFVLNDTNFHFWWQPVKDGRITRAHVIRNSISSSNTFSRRARVPTLSCLKLRVQYKEDSKTFYGAEKCSALNYLLSYIWWKSPYLSTSTSTLPLTTTTLSTLSLVSVFTNQVTTKPISLSPYHLPPYLLTYLPSSLFTHHRVLLPAYP